MKLVDWDKVKVSYDRQISGTITEPFYNLKIEAPVVEAIPIEWIKSKIDAILDSYPDGNEETEVLCKLLYEWEKENEACRYR